MKLTKGKIAKLYNKRKQTLKKKVKSKRGASKSKTFRQNKKVNLSRRSLKRFSYLGGRLPPSALDRGMRVVDAGLSGANAELSDAEELTYRVPPVVPGALEAQAGIYTAREGLTMAQEDLHDAKPALPEVNQPNQMTPAVDEPMTPPTDEQMTPAVDEQMTPAVDEQMTPAVDEPMTPAVDEPEFTPAVDEPMTPAVDESEYTPTVVESEYTPTVVEPELAEEIGPSEEQKNKLTDAIKTIVDEIAKQVESNLTDGSPQENSFDALTGAVSKLVPASGGKRRNTRRFKLVKNKTKRSAA